MVHHSVNLQPFNEVTFIIVLIALLLKVIENNLVPSPVTSNKLSIGLLYLRSVLLEYCVRLWIIF